MLNEQIHYVMRKSSTGLRRRAWISPASGDMFCGVCLRGRVLPELGATCSGCGSQVVGQMVAVSGGANRPAYAAVRAERRKREAERAVAAARMGNVLTMRAG
jgi:hypothetical protein